MKLILYTDPSYAKTLWFSQIFSGIVEEATRKRYSLTLLDSIPDDASELLGIFEGAKPVVVVIGASVSSLMIPLCSLWKAGIHTVLVNFKQELPTVHSSAIIMDYADAVRQGLRHMRSKGAKNIAFVGDYPDSGPDAIKRRSFIEEQHNAGIGTPELDVYSVTSEISDCCESFFNSGKKYDAVLCVNDIVAIALFRGLRERGLEKSMIISGFADPLISDFSVLLPGITTLSANHAELGRQTVLLCTWLEKNPSDISVTLRVPISIHPIKYEGISMGDLSLVMDDLSDDSMASEILRIEQCLASCDAVDKEIIRRILYGESYTEISEAIFASESTVRYRLSKLCDVVGVVDTNELISLLRPYLGNIGDK